MSTRLLLSATAVLAAISSLAAPRADAAQVRFTDFEARFDNTVGGVVGREDDAFSDSARLIWGSSYKLNGTTIYDPSYFVMDTYDGSVSVGETITIGRFLHNNGEILTKTGIDITTLSFRFNLQLVEDDLSVQDFGTYTSSGFVDHFEPVNPVPDTVLGEDNSRMFDIMSALTGDTYTVRIMEWMTAAIGGTLDPLFTTQEGAQTERFFQASVTMTPASPPPPPAIPLPAGLPLLLGGLGALAWAKRRI